MKRFIYAGILLFLMGMLHACSNSDDELTDEIVVEEIDVDLNRLLILVNEVRATGTTCGDTYYAPVESLVWSNKLEEAATLHSTDMYENDFFSHTSSDGTTLSSRLQDVNYNYASAGENIAFGYTTEESVINGWLNSQGHCANIMNPNFTEMGVGRVGNYWTQNFGKPR